MSDLLALGISHKTAPLELRERLALTEGRTIGLLSELRAVDQISEAAAISTCNRTELYIVAADPVAAESAALGALAGEAGIRPTELSESLISRRGIDAARHLFAVAAGLDSMILGEAEIQGQVKRAYELALIEGASGAILNRLLRGALSAGKRVRAETRIGAGGVSVASAAVELAAHALGDLGGRRALLVGAGDTAELAARALASRGVATVFVANRRYERASALAERFGGSAVRLDELPDQLERADIVVASTNSPYHVVERAELERTAAARGGRPLLVIDLAVPRDIDPGAREVAGIVLRDVDDVQAIVERNASGRAAERTGAERIIDAEVTRFERWLGSLEVLPTVAALRRHGDGVVDRVLAENRSRLAGISGEDRERVEAMARAVAGRILHEPTLRLKRTAEDEDSYQRLALLRELFGLDATAEPEAAGAEVRPLRPREAEGRGD